ncbi:MAG TPA: NlpC/P60 family protein, partial [Spirochaetales bacterium]|nr:NlpC/P60 family protein [Spirochaetales bacterium]
MGAGLSAQVLPDEALLISAAAGYLGTPYRYGGETSAGMDCSGFVMTSFKDIGIMAPRVSSAYAAFGSTVKDELRPGDILLFGDAGASFMSGFTLATGCSYMPRPTVPEPALSCLLWTKVTGNDTTKAPGAGIDTRRPRRTQAMRTRLLALCAFALFACAAQVTAEEPADLAERREATLRYGIEGQVIELLDALRSEKNSDFDQLIAELLESSTSPKLVVALLDYFSKSGSSAAEGRAAALIAGRDEQDDGVVGAAFSYLTAVKSGAALDDALTILKDGEKRYEQAAVKMLGAAGRAEHAAALRQKYDAYDSTPAIRQDILLALGGLASPDSFDLLAKVASDTGAGKV